MLHPLVVCTLLVVSAGEVEVRPLSGQAIRGELVSLSPEELVIAGTEGEQKIAVDSLLNVRPTEAAGVESEQATIWLELTDGSKLQATTYTVKDSVATVKLNTGSEVSIPTRAINWVRFNEQSDSLAKAWESLISEAVPGDRLVVRRTVDQEDPNTGQTRKVQSLDFLAGVLYDITPESLSFEFNDRKLNVGREKAEGLVYHHPIGRGTGEPVCIVQTAGGNIWRAKSVELAGEGWNLVSVSGVKHTLPRDHAQLLDYSAGKIVYLSDVEPETSQWQSFFGGKNEIPSLRQLFAPRRDRNFDGGPLKVGGQQYDRGLALHSRSELVFRLPGEYRKLSAVAGIDDSLGDNGHVVLRMYGDKDLLLEREISGADEEPLAVDLEITGVRRIRIEVDFGENLDIADHLNLCDIRVMK